jgi:dihydroorotate dehydrogenase electron transfer subunit
MGQQQGLEIIAPKELAQHIKASQTLKISAIQGTPLSPPDNHKFYLMMVQDLGLSACIFYLKKYRAHFKGFILIGAKSDFPFLPCPSRQLISGLPADVIAALPLLEDWHIPHRLASLKEQPGVYHGTITQLAKLWHSHHLQPFEPLVIDEPT